MCWSRNIGRSIWVLWSTKVNNLHAGYILRQKKLFQSLFRFLYLDNKDPLELYPSLELVKRKKDSNFSIICTTGPMKYYSRNFNWFKENGILPNTTTFVRHSTFLRLNIASLKVEDTGIYKCNVTNDQSLEDKRFQLIVFGMSIFISLMKVDHFDHLIYWSKDILTLKSLGFPLWFFQECIF